MTESKSIEQAQRKIIREMSDLEDSMEKYKYLVEQATVYNRPDKSLRSESNLISGCQSSVWLCVSVENDRVNLDADSEARIVRGILALLYRVIHNQPLEDVLSTELYFLEETELKQHLSPHRANGLQSIVEQIKTSCQNC